MTKKDEMENIIRELFSQRSDYSTITDIIEKANYKYRTAFSFVHDNMVIEIYSTKFSDRRIRITTRENGAASWFYRLDITEDNSKFLRGEDWDLNIKELPKEMVEYLEGTEPYDKEFPEIVT